MSSPTPTPPAHQYALDCVSGAKSVCKWVRLACKRYLDDRKNGHKRGITFDQSAADRVLNFSETCKHTQGLYAGKPFVLSDWEQFMVFNIFGFKKKNGNRRFTTIYAEIPKKNGKSTFFAMLGNYMLHADGEPRSNVYCVATTREQADEVFAPAKAMARESQYMKNSGVRIYEHSIVHEQSGSSFKRLGSKEDSLEGKNPHCAIIDEIHRHPDGGIVSVMKKGMIARAQPLLLMITNSGFNLESVCGEENGLAQKLLEGLIIDDSRFAIIFTIDEGDDWEAESTWLKANPELGRGVSLDGFRQQYLDAKHKPTELNRFKRFHLSIWTESEISWMPFHYWKRCNHGPINDTAWHGKTLIGAADLSAKLDFTAFGITWDDDDKLMFRLWLWMPEGTLKDRKYRAHIINWVDDGWVTRTGGDTVDYALIRDQIFHVADKAYLSEFHIDPWNATQISGELSEEGVNVIDYRQGDKSFTEPMGETEKAIVDGRLSHGGNPALSWMVSNVIKTESSSGSIKPNKLKSADKIDGAVVLIMAIGRAIKVGFEEPYTPEMDFL